MPNLTQGKMYFIEEVPNCVIGGQENMVVLMLFPRRKKTQDSEETPIILLVSYIRT